MNDMDAAWLNPEFRDRLSLATLALTKEHPGFTIRWARLHASHEQQGKLHEKYVNGDGPLASPAGSSLHEFPEEPEWPGCCAVDVVIYAGKVPMDGKTPKTNAPYHWWSGIVARYGLWTLIKHGDGGHTQPQGYTIQMAKAGIAPSFPPLPKEGEV